MFEIMALMFDWYRGKEDCAVGYWWVKPYCIVLGPGGHLWVRPYCFVLEAICGWDLIALCWSLEAICGWDLIALCWMLFVGETLLHCAESYLWVRPYCIVLEAICGWDLIALCWSLEVICEWDFIALCWREFVDETLLHSAGIYWLMRPSTTPAPSIYIDLCLWYARHDKA